MAIIILGLSVCSHQSFLGSSSTHLPFIINVAYSLLVVGPIWPSSVSVDAEFVGSSINNGINILLYWSKGKCASTIMDAVMDQSYIVCLQTPTIIDWPWVTMLMNIAIFARGQPGHYLKCVRTKLPELEFNFSPRCTTAKLR